MAYQNRGSQLLICSLIISWSPLSAGVRIQVRDGRPIVDGVTVNGHGPYRFMIDTGANINLIDARLARKIGMTPSFTVDLASAAGKTPTQGSDGNQVQLDTVKATGQKFLFSPLDAIHNSSPDVQGVLGQWFLGGFDYLLDLRGKRLEFGKQNPTGTRAPFTLRNARTVVSTSLGDLVLDSGASKLVLFGVDPEAMRQSLLRTVAGSQPIGAKFSTLTIADRKIWQGEAVTMRTHTEPEVAGLLPLNLFKSVYVCNSEGYLIFE